MARLVYDYSKLKGRIKEKCNTQEEFASKLGLSARSVSLKLSNARGWKQNEITNAIRVLGLTDADIQPYFFTVKVQRCEH